MAEKLDTINILNLSGGIIQKIGDELASSNCVHFAENVRFDKILGRATVREGTSLIGAQISNGYNILGLHQFILSSGTKYLLSVIDGATNAQINRLESGSWVGKTAALTKNTKVRFLTYLNIVVALNGIEKFASTDGSTWVSTGTALDMDNFPLGKFAVEWHDRIYTAGVSGYPDRLYYSSIPTDLAIDWTSDSAGYIDVEPYEGQGTITALAKVPGYVLIFKERSLKRWNGSSTYPDDLCKYGTSSFESVVLGKNTAFFFSSGYSDSVGFYETNGETTRKISRPIQEIVDAISSNNYENIAGVSDGEKVMWSIGNITFDGITYSNAHVMYHIDTQTWTLLTFPTKYLAMSSYIDGSDLYLIAGDNDGQVIKLFTGLSDNITGKSNIEIPFCLQYHPKDLGARYYLKNIAKIIPATEGLSGCVFMCRTDKNKADSFNSLGSISDDYETIFNKNIIGHVFEFKYIGTTIAGGTIIGFDIITPEITLSNEI